MRLKTVRTKTVTVPDVPRHGVIFGVLALVVAFLLTHGLIARPSYTDSYYYFNAAERWVSGQGLTDAYLWNYVGMPDSLPAPSHGYWMPFTSIAAGIGMAIFNAPGDYDAAQVPFALMLAATACVGFWLGWKLGGSRRHMWVAGLLTLFGGFFVRFWGQTDTFAPYGFAGSLALVFLGLAATSSTPNRMRFWFLGGLFAGLGHLTRADGVLLLLVGYLVILWPFGGQHTTSTKFNWKDRGRFLIVITMGYLVVMGPWFLRNLDAFGSPLPVGGASSIWHTQYDDLFNYPPEASPEILFADGLVTFFESRWIALYNNFFTFIAVEGMVIITPLMLIALWNRRRHRLLLPFALYTLGLHVAMTFVFSFAGFRGGLFHSAAALIPFWMALGVVGLDDTVDWIARRRRNWRPQTAKRVFSAGLVLLGLILSYNIAMQGRVYGGTPGLYRELDQLLPQDAIVMINDPAILYFFTERGGVVIPNASVAQVPEIVERYGVTHLLVETAGGALAVPSAFDFDRHNPPSFATLVEVGLPGARLYALNP